MKEFEVLTKIYFGPSSLDRLKDLPDKSVMIFADPFVVSSGLIRLVTERLERAAITYSIYQDIVPDPPIEKVIAGVSALLRTRPGCMIAVGGGSAIDLSKSVRKFAEQVEPGFRPRLIAIPTTSGTGSEVTSISVITEPDKNVKHPLSSRDMIPDEAILDADLVKSVPAGITADTGMDVLTHAIEAYVSIENNEFSGALAEKSVEICGQFLIRSYSDNTDTHARQKMHVASCLAGLAFNSASLGLCHGMAHQLGANFHIPHGRANAILLPHIIEYNSEIDLKSRSKEHYNSCVRKYCNLARILGVNNFNEVTTIRALVGYMQFLMKEMHVPLRISEIGGISEGEYMARVETMADAALIDACTTTNPRAPRREEVIELFRAIW